MSRKDEVIDKLKIWWNSLSEDRCGVNLIPYHPDTMILSRESAVSITSVDINVLIAKPEHEYWAAINDDGDIMHWELVDPDHGVTDEHARALVNQFISDVLVNRGPKWPENNCGLIHLRKMTMESLS